LEFYIQFENIRSDSCDTTNLFLNNATQEAQFQPHGVLWWRLRWGCQFSKWVRFQFI